MTAEHSGNQLPRTGRLITYRTNIDKVRHQIPSLKQRQQLEQENQSAELGFSAIIPQQDGFYQNDVAQQSGSLLWLMEDVGEDRGNVNLSVSPLELGFSDNYDDDEVFGFDAESSELPPPLMSDHGSVYDDSSSEDETSHSINIHHEWLYEIPATTKKAEANEVTSTSWDAEGEASLESLISDERRYSNVATRNYRLWLSQH